MDYYSIGYLIVFFIILETYRRHRDLNFHRTNFDLNLNKYSDIIISIFQILTKSVSMAMKATNNSTSNAKPMPKLPISNLENLS